MKKVRKQLTFWKRIRFKYKLSFLNESTLEEVFSFRLSRLSAYLTIGIFILLLIVLTSVVIINTPIRNYLPGYSDSEVRTVMMNNALRADSLEQILSVQSLYLDNINSVLRGDLPVDSIQKLDSLPTSTAPNLGRSEETSRFIKGYEEEEKYNINAFSSSAALPDNLIFYKPVKGIISSHFSVREKHYGTDIAAKENESVLATMKGTIIFAGFDANAGYIIQIQHSNGFVSIYKHNAILLKNQGAEVNAGEAIALVGNTGKLSTGTHLHFELWYNGKPVNPEEFIVF